MKVLQNNRTNSKRECVGGVCACQRKRNLFQERFILRNYLTWLWRPASPKTGRVDQQAREAGKRCITKPKAVCWQSSLWRVISHFLKSFNWLPELHSHNGGKLALLKVTDVSIIPPRKYLPECVVLFDHIFGTVA